MKDKDGTIHQFNQPTAEKAMRDAVLYAKNGVPFFSLPKDSPYKFVDGALVKKAVKKEKEKETVETTETGESSNDVI